MKRFIYLLITVAMIVSVSACSKTASDKKAESTVAHAQMTVNGSCGMCKNRIEKAAKAIEGVETAEWSLDEQKLHLHFDSAKTSLDAISKAVAQAGHETEFDKVPDEVYDSLPGCCQYRK